MMGLATLPHCMTLDGGLFVFIGLIVLLAPSPQPALTTPVDEVALGPFKDTRRLLASQFVAVGLMLFMLGWFVRDMQVLRVAALLLVGSLLLVIAINLSQLRHGSWKPQPLYFLIGIFTVFSLTYVFLIISG